MRLLLMTMLLAPAAGAAELRVTLKAAEDGALAVSNSYRAASLSAEAAEAAAAAAGAALKPRVHVRGNQRRHDGFTADVDSSRARRNLHVAEPTHLGDRAAVDQHRPRLNRR